MENRKILIQKLMNLVQTQIDQTEIFITLIMVLNPITLYLTWPIIPTHITLFIIPILIMLPITLSLITLSPITPLR